jgi:DNA (cytosine-5)-methyltransferase 1
VSDLTAASLFAGVGGFDLAMHRAGVKVAAAVEIDPACRGVLRRHFPQAKVFNDVTEVTGEQLRAAGFVPGRGILCFGWPCQGNSVAGRRQGMADPRSGLWRHVVRIVAEARPRWLLGENVPGLLSINGGRDFGTVIRDLDELGYGVAWRVLDAQFFGVPQRRRRVFLAGCLGDPAGPVEVLFEPEGGAGNPAESGAAGSDVAGTIGSRAGGSRTTDLDGHGAYVPTVGTLGTSGPGGGWRLGADEAAAGQLVTAATLQGGGRRGHRIDAEGAAGGHLIAATLTAGNAVSDGVRPPGRRAEDDVNLIAGAFPVALRGRAGGSQVECGEAGDPAFTVRTPGGGSSYPMVAGTLRSHPRPGSNSFGAVTPADPMAFNPQTGGSKGRIGYGDKPTALRANQVTGVQTEAAVRRLTPVECERLQGFPDDWTRCLDDGAVQSDSARYQQCGNAVAVPVVEWVARRIVAAERAAEVEGAA